MTPPSTLPQHFIHTHVTIELSTTMYEQLARGSLSYSSFLSLTLSSVSWADIWLAWVVKFKLRRMGRHWRAGSVKAWRNGKKLAIMSPYLLTSLNFIHFVYFLSNAVIMNIYLLNSPILLYLRSWEIKNWLLNLLIELMKNVFPQFISGNFIAL